jgi:sarcosine oxidase subunit gamma
MNLSDFSSLPRAGIKGKDLSPWIESRGYRVGMESNRAYLQDDGVLAVRLSPGELMLISDPDASATEALSMTSFEATYKCYPVRRRDSHYWFALGGRRAHEMFAKLCGVNLSPEVFVDHAVAQTSVARTSAIIVRHDNESALRYYLLGDSSTVLYMWNCLVDAMKEFDGQIID